MMQMNKTPSSNYKIRFNDCDMFGHLNNARYVDYMINAREDHLKEQYNFDFGQYYKNDLGWFFAGHEIVYLRPAAYNEIVVIQSSLIDVRVDLLIVEVLMLNETKDRLKAMMRSKLVPVNIKTGRKGKHPNEFMNWALALIDGETIIHNDFQERVKHVTKQIIQITKNK
jgi:YbgC/YbaW family acyl-CoA thioester hydrolase